MPAHFPLMPAAAVTCCFGSGRAAVNDTSHQAGLAGSRAPPFYPSHSPTALPPTHPPNPLLPLPPAPGWIACDPLAFCLALCPEALLAAEPRHCSVELRGALTRGMSVLQAPGGTAKLPANVLLVKEVCMQRFKALMEAATD